MDIKKLSKITDGLREDRMSGLTDQIDYYFNLAQKKSLSKVQIEQLKDLRDTVLTFGNGGLKWAQRADEILKENGYNDDTMSLYAKELGDSAKVKDSADSAPSVYVGTYNKYNSGSLKGEWVDLTDFADEEEFMNYCHELHADDGDPEIMFQDYQNFPEAWYHESSVDFDKIMEWYNLPDDEKQAVEEYLDEVYTEDDIQTILDNLIGRMSIEDYAYECLEEGILGNLDYYFDYKKFARDCELDGSFDPEEYPEYDGDAEQWLYDLIDDIGEDNFFKDLEERGLLENYVDIDMLCRDLSYDLTETTNYLFHRD